MAYYLDDIADYLVAQGYTGVTVDLYQPDLKNQICVLSLSGERIQPEQPLRVVEWQILVTSNESAKQQARTKSEEIMKLLVNKRGKLTSSDNSFLKIICTQPPYFIGLNKSGLSEFTAIYQARIGLTDIESIYN